MLRLLAPAGRPLSARDGRGRGRGVRDRRHERAAALVERATPRRRGPRRGPRGGARGGARARVRARERGRGVPAPRAGRPRRRGRPAAVGADPPPRRRGRGRSPISRSWRCTTTGVALDAPAAGRAAIAAADLAAAVDSPADELAALELAISAQGTTRRPAADVRRGRGAAGAGAARPRSRPTDLAIRAAEAAFAADRPVRAAAYLDATIGAADARQDRTRLGLIYDRLGQFRRVAGDAEGAVAARRRAVELVPTSAVDRPGGGRRRARPAAHARGHVLGGRAARPRRDPRRAGLRAARRGLGAPRDDDARGRRSAGGPIRTRRSRC